MPDSEEFEERAAILEFDGGLPRPEAEKQARLLVDLAEVDRWLNVIDERDPAIRAHVLRQCRTDPGALQYFLRHAKEDFLH